MADFATRETGILPFAPSLLVHLLELGGVEKEERAADFSLGGHNAGLMSGMTTSVSP